MDLDKMISELDEKIAQLENNFVDNTLDKKENEDNENYIFDDVLLVENNFNLFFTEKTYIRNKVICKQKFESENLVVCDPFVTDKKFKNVFKNKIPIGEYDVVAINKKNDLDTLLAVALNVKEELPTKYYMGIYKKSDVDYVKEKGRIGFVSDGGCGCILDEKNFDNFCDYAIESADEEMSYLFYDNDTDNYKVISNIPNVLDFCIFTTGYGDGFYPVYFGYNANNELCKVLINFEVISDVAKFINEEKNVGIT